MCKNIKCKPLTYRCSRKSCDKIVQFKNGNQLKAFNCTGNLNFINWRYCEECFSDLVEFITSFNKTIGNDVYSRAIYILIGEEEKHKKLKDLYEGKIHKQTDTRKIL